MFSKRGYETDRKLTRCEPIDLLVDLSIGSHLHRAPPQFGLQRRGKLCNAVAKDFDVPTNFATSRQTLQRRCKRFRRPDKLCNHTANFATPLQKISTSRQLCNDTANFATPL